jgi:hypothetical protein
MTSNNIKIDPGQSTLSKPSINKENFFKTSQNPFKIRKTFLKPIKTLHKPTKLFQTTPKPFINNENFLKHKQTSTNALTNVSQYSK